MTNQQLQLIQDLRHALHQCPEISGQEVRTKALLQQFLRAHTTLELQPCGEGFTRCVLPGKNRRHVSASSDGTTSNVCRAPPHGAIHRS